MTQPEAMSTPSACNTIGVWRQVFWCTAVLLVMLHGSHANRFAKKLYVDLLMRSGYNRLIRPVKHVSEKVIVTIGIKFSQLIDVDERSQYMTTNMWFNQEWEDPNLRWNPMDYDNVTEIYVPAESIWHPDIVLYNNADGVYQLTMETKAKLTYNGTVKWRPPASLKSTCTMNVRYFPFDEQTCEMKFGSWTYNINEVEIQHYNQSLVNDKGFIAVGMDMGTFYRNVEWDVMSVPALFSLQNHTGDVEAFPVWTFQINLRRKYRFYVVNLVIPLVSHAFLTILVFYLPSDSREKISLCINILLSLTVYFLMLAEIIPPTSLVVPLLGEYLIFTLILVTLSVIITGITLNIHFRSSATHKMPNWIRKLFLYFLPRLLKMKRPKIENSHDVQLKHIQLNLCSCFGSPQDEHDPTDYHGRYHYGSKRSRAQAELMKMTRSMEEHQQSSLHKEFSPEVANAIEGAIYIANHLKEEDEFNRTKEDWKYVALVVDRMFLFIYITLCTVGTLSIICNAPMLFDSRPSWVG